MLAEEGAVIGQLAPPGRFNLPRVKRHGHGALRFQRLKLPGQLGTLSFAFPDGSG